MPDHGGVVHSAADAIADDIAVDWEEVDRTVATSTDYALLQQLKIISIIAASPHRTAVPADLRERLWPMRLIYWMILRLGAGKALAAILIALFAAASGTALQWPNVSMVVLFGLSGLVLVSGGTSDPRLRALGALFVLNASAFADPLLRASVSGTLGHQFLLVAPSEAFLALAVCLWSFPWEPSPIEQRVGSVFIYLSAGVGLLLFVANTALDRQVPSLAFWPLLFAIAILALGYFVWTERDESDEERRRGALAVAALALGIAPMLLTVVISPWVTPLTDPVQRRLASLSLYAALAGVIPAAYVLVIRRLTSFRLDAARTVQHTAARGAIWLAVVGPITYLCVHLYAYRHQTVADVLAGGQGVELLLLLLVAVGALTFREQLLTLIDGRFQLRPIDCVEALARLERAFRSAGSMREVMGILTSEIDRVVHPKAAVALIANEDGSELVSLSNAVRPLRADAPLVELLRAARSDILLDAGWVGPTSRLLPLTDRQWLAEHGFIFLSPLVGSSGALIGFLALAESRTGLPYTRQHRAFITAMAGEAALKLENQLLRGASDRAPATSARARARLETMDWSNEPGVYCPECSCVWLPRTIICPCGAETAPAALPRMLKGNFQVERLIKAGGMGVVYLAIDIALDRRVALKVLPMSTPENDARLQREARAMASVLHPNLAMIFGLEYWRATPLLIVEYLEGGTLANRLRDGPLTVPAVIDLGVVMADVLDRVHGSGMLHRDIKPSNIAYTREGTPKLLDFGLAAMLDRPRADECLVTRGNDNFHLPDSLSGWAASTTLTLAGQVVGTPLYLAPEAVRGDAPQLSFDLWSLSLMLYEALAGRLPLAGKTAGEVIALIAHFRLPDVREFRPDCPADVASFLESALDLSPSRRPTTARELRDGLQRLRIGLRPIDA